MMKFMINGHQLNNMDPSIKVAREGSFMDREFLVFGIAKISNHK